MYKLLVLLFLAITATFSSAQNFDPNVDDVVYLNSLQQKLKDEVNATRAELVRQAKITEMAAKLFVTAQLKENLFIALRVIAEKELMEMKKNATNNGTTNNETTQVQNMTEVVPIARQEDNDERENNKLYPQVSNLIQAIFGTKSNMTKGNFVDKVTPLQNEPVGGQVLGLVMAMTENINNLQLEQEPQRLPSPLDQHQEQPLIAGPVLDVPLSPGAAGAYLPDIENQQNLEQEPESQIFISPNNFPEKIQRPSDETLESFLAQFHATQFQISQGAGNNQRNNGSNNNPNGGSKPFNYNQSGAKGVAGSGATLRPSLTQQLNVQGLTDPQPSSNQFGPPGQGLFPPNVNGGQGQGPNQGQNQGPGQNPNVNQGLNQGPDQNPNVNQGPEDPEGTETTESTPAVTDEDDDEDEDGEGDANIASSKTARQFNLINILSNVFQTTRRPDPITPAPVAVQKVTITTGADGQAVIVQDTTGVVAGQPGAPAAGATMPEAFNIRTFAETVGKNMGDIIRIMPDVFRGAREGVQLISTITRLFGGLDALGDVAGGIL